MFDHIGIAVSSFEKSVRFYEAALAGGGKDNGNPGLRENYAPTYYAAFVHDPDGHNVEAVCQTAE